VELGSQGPAVEALQQNSRVSLISRVNRRVFDWETRQAVIAFQKVQDSLAMGWVAGPRPGGAAHRYYPTPRLAASGNRVGSGPYPTGGLLYRKYNQVVKTLACSTGKPGWLTPPGHYHVYRKIPAWHKSSLALLLQTLLFTRSVGLPFTRRARTCYPGSHGCLRSA